VPQLTHAHAHPHAQALHTREAGARRLAWTLGLVAAYMVAEIAGGLWTGSLALLADAGHMLSDAASLALALFAMRLARRPRGARRSFGFHRGEILAALANGAALAAAGVVIAIEAWERLSAPPRPVAGQPMMWIAAGGLLVNVAALAILHRDRDASLNLRGAWLHVATDSLGSVQAVVAGALIWRFGWQWADPLASLLIAALVIWSAWTLLRDSVTVLMEAAPAHIDTAAVAAAIAGVPGVVGVHDLHVWTITSGFDSLSAHAHVAGRDRDAVLSDVRSVLAQRFAIEHCTIQLEGEEGCEDGRCD
jgi:cobalt-zinc-cadmium efflux system protein